MKAFIGQGNSSGAKAQAHAAAAAAEATKAAKERQGEEGEDDEAVAAPKQRLKGQTQKEQKVPVLCRGWLAEYEQTSTAVLLHECVFGRGRAVGREVVAKDRPRRCVWCSAIRIVFCRWFRFKLLTWLMKSFVVSIMYTVGEIKSSGMVAVVPETGRRKRSTTRTTRAPSPGLRSACLLIFQLW